MLEFLVNKAGSLKACNFIKKRLQHRYFPGKFAKFLRTTFFYRNPAVAASDVSIKNILRKDVNPLLRNVVKWSDTTLRSKGLNLSDSNGIRTQKHLAKLA